MEGQKSIFEQQTAWFSTSCEPKWKDIWVSNGGRLETVDSAMFIFGEDGNASDIQKVFKSEAYLREHVAIFHPAYVGECAEMGDMKKVTAGKYQLHRPEENVHIEGDTFKGPTKTHCKSKPGGNGKLSPVADKSVVDKDGDTGRNIAAGDTSNECKVMTNKYLQVEDLPQVSGEITRLSVDSK